MKRNSFEKLEGKEHLDKDFLEELKHKIWSTKGTRFRADNRLKLLSKISVLTTSMLSLYLIIFGLLSVYNIYNPDQDKEDLFSFSLTAISIVLLLFSLFESAQDYKLKAKNFHDCGLDLADLYNQLQNFKSYKKDASNDEKMDFSENLHAKYQEILRRYENHKPIDNKMFKASHLDYYKHLGWYYGYIVQGEYFLKTKIPYLIAIVIPAIILGILIFGYK